MRVKCGMVGVALSDVHVYMWPMSPPRKKGHPDVFTAPQNRTLRAELRKLQARRHYSQTALANILGIAQQNAGRLLASEESGFSYQSATRLARALGYRGVDELFRDKRVELPDLPRSGTEG